MHTDRAAFTRWTTAAGAPDPLRPPSPEARQALIDLSSDFDHVGCTHLRGLLTEEKAYLARSALVRFAIMAFMEAYIPADNSSVTSALHRDRNVIFVVSNGPADNRAVLSVFTPSNLCPNLAPLVVPRFRGRSGSRSYLVLHPTALAVRRRGLARSLCERAGVPDSYPAVLAQMNLLGQAQMERTLLSGEGAGKVKYDVLISDD